MAADRRRQSRLRELCDEVLASYRSAAGLDLISDNDRADARAMFLRWGRLGAETS